VYVGWKDRVSIGPNISAFIAVHGPKLTMLIQKSMNVVVKLGNPS
jgi:hypothetical protein